MKKAGPQPPPAAENLPASPSPQKPAKNFANVDNNLTNIGFFTASSKRSREESEKTVTIHDQGIERRITILAGGNLGLPITQDQDYWLALMKLVGEHVQQTGKLQNPFSFTTAELIKILGQVHCGQNYKAVLEWADVITYTGVKGGAYDASRRRWLIERTHVVDRFVTMGKELPNGKIADKNYVWFSEWQLDNINSGKLIPIELSSYIQLNTNIARHLVPYLQEWLYASQRDGHFEKNYEDICQLLGIRVYAFLSDITRKLSPSMDELVAHGYLAKWVVEPRASGKGYKLIFWHGQKYFKDREARLQGRRQAELPEQPASPQQEQLPLTAAADPAVPLPPTQQELIAEFEKRGIGETDAHQILGALRPGQRVLDQLEWGDYQIAHQRTRIDNPPGFYISLLQRNVPVPANFITSNKSKELEAAERARQEAWQEQRLETERAEREERARIEARIAALPEARRRALYEMAKARLVASHPGMMTYFRTNPDSAMEDGAVRGKMRQILQEWEAAQSN